MLLGIAALALQLAGRAIAVASVPTTVDEGAAGIFPRETGLFGLAPTCTSVLLEVTPIPLPPSELMELLVRLNAKGGDPCSFSFVSSMAAAYTSYQSDAVLWLSKYSAKLSSECPAILSLQSQYAPATCATTTSSSTMNNATTMMRTTTSGSGAVATTSSANSSDGESSRTISTAGIAGAAVGSAAGLALLASVVFFFIRKARRSRGAETQKREQPGELYDANKPESLQHKQSIYEMPQPESPSELIGNTVHPVELGCRTEPITGPVYELSVEKESATNQS